MEVKEVIKKLEESSKFKKDKKSYLAHLFKMVDDLNKGDWQIGYYNDDNTITTYVIEDDKINVIPSQEVFQKTQKKVKKLNMNKVKMDIDKALDISKEFQQKKFSTDPPLKIMVILQNIANNTIYNVTYITRSFKTLNIKIDAVNGKIINHELTNMLQFQGKAS
ncbi:hypothetical protein CEE44_01850 [Candidatus Woesearchaeota archaeon B3_Woes]|nr:MAG: hypothetical protein CEE44_01850 [Candidatus Woesearchaeota archaeon B3_Woes]